MATKYMQYQKPPGSVDADFREGLYVNTNRSHSHGIENADVYVRLCSLLRTGIEYLKVNTTGVVQHQHIDRNMLIVIDNEIYVGLIYIYMLVFVWLVNKKISFHRFLPFLNFQARKMSKKLDRHYLAC
jgi:hypothetical protein